jgi:hypothetical protein
VQDIVVQEVQAATVADAGKRVEQSTHELPLPAAEVEPAEHAMHPPSTPFV